MGVIMKVYLIFGGFFAGAVLTSVVGRWIMLVRETAAMSSPHPWRMAALISLFHAGPWLLVALGIFVYYEWSEEWLKWIAAGIVAWSVFVGQFVYQVKKRKAQDAK